MRLNGLGYPALMALAVTMLGWGCSSPHHAGTGSMAAVLVTNQPPLEIAKGVSAAFNEAGFTTVPLPSNQAARAEYRLVFERPASTGDTVLYGDWSFKRNWYRAKVRIVRQEQRKFLVTCDAFRVTNRGDGHFEEEKRLAGGKGGQYQKLLEQAVAKLPAERIGTAPAF